MTARNHLQSSYLFHLKEEQREEEREEERRDGGGERERERGKDTCTINLITKADPIGNPANHEEVASKESH